MIMEAYKYNMDEAYQTFKCLTHELLYKCEVDEDVSEDEFNVFKLYLEQLKDDFKNVG